MPFTTSRSQASRTCASLMLVSLVLILATTVAGAQQGEPLVTATLTLAEADQTAAPGDTVGISARGFFPRRTVEIVIEPDRVRIGLARADEDGRIDTEVRIPTGLPEGRYTLKASGFAPGGEILVQTSPIDVEVDERPAGPLAFEENRRTVWLFGFIIPAAVVAVCFLIGTARNRRTSTLR